MVSSVGERSSCLALLAALGEAFLLRIISWRFVATMAGTERLARRCTLGSTECCVGWGP